MDNRPNSGGKFIDPGPRPIGEPTPLGNPGAGRGPGMVQEKRAEGAFNEPGQQIQPAEPYQPSGHLTLRSILEKNPSLLGLALMAGGIIIAILALLIVIS